LSSNRPLVKENTSHRSQARTRHDSVKLQLIIVKRDPSGNFRKKLENSPLSALVFYVPCVSIQIVESASFAPACRDEHRRSQRPPGPRRKEEKEKRRAGKAERIARLPLARRTRSIIARRAASLSRALITTPSAILQGNYRPLRAEFSLDESPVN